MRVFGYTVMWVQRLKNRQQLSTVVHNPQHFLHIFHFCGIVFTAIFVSCEGAHCLRLEILSSFHTDSTKIGHCRENKMNKTKTHHGARCHFRIPSSRGFLSTRSNSWGLTVSEGISSWNCCSRWSSAPLFARDRFLSYESSVMTVVLQLGQRSATSADNEGSDRQRQRPRRPTWILISTRFVYSSQI